MKSIVGFTDATYPDHTATTSRENAVEGIILRINRARQHHKDLVALSPDWGSNTEVLEAELQNYLYGALTGDTSKCKRISFKVPLSLKTLEGYGIMEQSNLFGADGLDYIYIGMGNSLRISNKGISIIDKNSSTNEGLDEISGGLELLRALHDNGLKLVGLLKERFKVYKEVHKLVTEANLDMARLEDAVTRVRPPEPVQLPESKVFKPTHLVETHGVCGLYDAEGVYVCSINTVEKSLKVKRPGGRWQGYSKERGREWGDLWDKATHLATHFKEEVTK